MSAAGVEMANCIQGTTPSEMLDWVKAGNKCGAAAMAGDPVIYVQKMAGTAYKYIHQATAQTQFGLYSYYVHVRNTQPALVFRRIGTIYVATTPTELLTNGRVKLSSTFAFSGNALPDCTIPLKDSSMAYLRQELQRLMVWDHLCSDQTKIVFVPTAQPQCKISKTFKIELDKLRQNMSGKESIKSFLTPK